MADRFRRCNLPIRHFCEGPLRQLGQLLRHFHEPQLRIRTILRLAFANVDAAVMPEIAARLAADARRS